MQEHEYKGKGQDCPEDEPMDSGKKSPAVKGKGLPGEADEKKTPDTGNRS